MKLPWIKSRNTISKRTKIVALLIIAFVLLVIIRQAGNKDIVERQAAQKSVSVISLDTYVEDTSRVRAQGQIESSAQAELRSEVSARVTQVYTTLGQEVRAGQLLVSFDSAGLYARMQQAQADLAAAEAGLLSANAGLSAQQSQLQDLENGGRPEQVAIAQAQLATAQDALNELYTGTQNVLDGMIASVEDILFTDIDPLFTDPRTDDPTLVFSTTQAYQQTLAQGNRATLNTILPEWGSSVGVIDGVDPVAVSAALLKAETNILFIQDFLQTLSVAIGNEVSLTDTEEQAFTSTVAGARSAMSGFLTTVRSRRQAIQAQRLAVSQAADQLSLTQQGASTDQVATQQALVDQASAGFSAQEAGIARAKGVIAGIQADLSKHAIRSPISGTVAALPLRKGELVSPGTLAASIVNTNGLQVKAFIDSSDATAVSIGSKVLVDGSIEAVVSTIAPSIDPTTRKVEVGIAITEDLPSLIVGQFVAVDISKSTYLGDAIQLPLRAIEVGTNGSHVFVVNEQMVVEKRPVVLGRVIGESVEVLSGLDGVSDIISSVRGVTVGDTVTIR